MEGAPSDAKGTNAHPKAVRQRIWGRKELPLGLQLPK